MILLVTNSLFTLYLAAALNRLRREMAKREEERDDNLKLHMEVAHRDGNFYIQQNGNMPMT